MIWRTSTQRGKAARSRTRLNAETQRARRYAEEQPFFFVPSLRPSANLCVSALILRSFQSARSQLQPPSARRVLAGVIGRPTRSLRIRVEKLPQKLSPKLSI